METVIVTKNLTKRYGDFEANSHVNLNVVKGEIYGLIGRNGAGKTTLMKMLIGLTNPTEGTIELEGSTDLEKTRLKMGSIIETPTFFDKVSAYHNLVYYAKLCGIKDYKNKVNQMLRTVGLYEKRNRKVKKYSLGMRQKLGIAMALLKDPDILILDEPINGLDPVAIAEVRQLLLDINQRKGTTILISSHILGEMQKIATRYGFIVNGQLANEITEQEVKEKGIDLEDYSLKLMGVKANG